MGRHVILAQSEYTAAALCAWIDLIGRKPPTKESSEYIVFTSSSGEGELGVRAYEHLVSRIESAAAMADGSLALNDVVVLVDSVDPASMNAAAENENWNHLIAMLILTFPEIKWLFGVISEAGIASADGWAFPAEQHDLPSLITKPRRDPLLDPTGLREWVRSVTSKALAKQGVILPHRLHCAAAIDEEKGFAYFHAYTAYRFGFRADTVTSWALMQSLFGATDGSPHGYYLLLEDMSLKFPDKPNNTGIVDLKKRGQLCPQLGYGSTTAESSHFRILITTGQAGDDHLLPTADDFLHKEKQNGRVDVLAKPVGGMLDLWENAGLFRDLDGKKLAGNAPGYVSLESKGAEAGNSDHGSPGKLMLIAEVLFRRAEVFRSDARTVKDFIKGATLATDAMELLSGRTPTITLATLALKHEYEVRAECRFIGVGYHFDVATRQQEIERDVREISKWFKVSMRPKAELDARIVIMNRIATAFREAGQYDEEQQALVALRWAHRILMFRQTSNPLKWATNVILLYAEFLLVSFRNFMFAIFGWLSLATLIWWPFTHSLTMAVEQTINTFYGGNPLDKGSSTAILATCGLVVLGSFHVGVFISYLYSLVSRR